MKNLAIIKSERSLNMVTNLYAKKVKNAVYFYDSVHVDVEDFLKGKIKNIVVWCDHHMMFFPVIDSVREVIDEVEKKYDSYCVVASFQTKPYLAKDNETWLSMPVIEISFRVKQA